MLSMLLLAGAVSIGHSAQNHGIVRQESTACATVEQQCVRVACEDECWEIRVTYDSGEGIEYTTTGGLWGSISGARCEADKVAVQGFWMDPAGALQPTKVAPGALRKITIDRAAP